MVLTQAHEDGGNSKANRLLAKVCGHLWRLDDVSVEAVVRVLKKRYMVTREVEYGDDAPACGRARAHIEDRGCSGCA